MLSPNSECVDLPLPESIWTTLLESNAEDFPALVEVLSEKSERLKKEATKPKILQSIAKHMIAVSGLGLVDASGKGDAVASIFNDPVESTSNIMLAYSMVNFISIHS